MCDNINLYDIIRGYAYKRCQILKGESKEIIDEFISIAYLDFYDYIMKFYDESKGKPTTYIYKVLNLNSFMYFLQAKYEISRSTAKSLLNNYYKKDGLSEEEKREKLKYNLRIYDTKSLSTSFDSIDISEDTNDEDLTQALTLELSDIDSEKQFEQIYYKEIISEILDFVNSLEHKSEKSKLIFMDYVKGMKYSDIARKYNCSKQNVDQHISGMKHKIKKKFRKYLTLFSLM